jgi:hypothetical protein
VTPPAPALRSRALAALALLAAACPLPQPLTDVPRTPGTAIPPPRILTDSISPVDTVIPVARGCPGGASFVLRATVHDDTVLEQVDARWFVDYAPDPLNARPYHVDALAPPDDPNQLDRPLPPLTLQLPASDTAALHVTELVVSNGFYVLDDPAAPLRNRSAQPGFEAQVFRWVFSYVDAGGRCQ